MKRTIFYLILLLPFFLGSCSNDNGYILSDSAETLTKTVPEIKPSKMIVPIDYHKYTLILTTAPSPSITNQIQLLLSTPLSQSLRIYLKVYPDNERDLFCPSILIPAGTRYIITDLPFSYKAVADTSSKKKPTIDTGNRQPVNVKINYITYTGPEDLWIDSSILNVSYGINDAIKYKWILIGTFIDPIQ
ncbi:MAG: hypothetical protein Q8914_07020 [Bacteroidota bacterium]|nr:hypothetical protein [Bacteroidota bacterium]